MGFALTILYIAISILSPDEIMPALAPFRPVLCLGIVALLVSVPSFLRFNRALLSMQTLLLAAFTMQIAVSEVANHWLGGVLWAYGLFLPVVVAYLLIVANVDTFRRARVLIGSLVVIAFVLVGEALCSYYTGWQSDAFQFTQNLFVGEHYVGSDIRLRAVGFLNDPNDFAQFLIATIPLIFLRWQKRRFMSNVLWVFVPCGIIGWAIFLTHSRGVLIGIAVLLLLTFRNRLGVTASSLLSAISFVALLLLGFTGGRGISAEEGAGRLEAWSTGLDLVRHSPLFGVGWGRFTEHFSHTAHNSFVLCFSELGLIGCTIWTFLLALSLVELNSLAKGAPSIESGSELESDLATDVLLPQSGRGQLGGTGLGMAPEIANVGVLTEPPDPVVAVKDDAARYARAIWFSLIAFLVTAWFLSRTYVVNLYILIALSAVLLNLAGDNRRSAAILRTRGLLVKAIAAQFALIVIIYVTVRANGQ